MRKVFVATLLALAAAAHAEFITGNNLLNSLKKEGSQDRAIAVGYVVGVTDTIMGSVTCPPPGVTPPQIVDLVQQWLEQNPRLRHNSGDRVVAAVLGQAWPCETTKGGGRGV